MIFYWILAVMASTTSTPALAGPPAAREVEKPLKISGQTRNLSMLLVLKSDKDQVKFAHVRLNYRDKFAQVKY